MTLPRMMPGQDPYSDDEIVGLARLVSGAAEEDPGERAEPRAVYLREAVVVYRPRRRPPGTRVASSADVVHVLRGLLGDRVTEHFIIIGLDAKHRPMAWTLVALGSIDSCGVEPIDVFRFAVLAACPAIVIAHNHPSGDPEPSAEDEAFTRRIVEGARLLGIRVLDHVIVAEGAAYSFLDAGRM